MLKAEVGKAWKLVESAKDKEEKARKIIQDLKGEIAHLHKIVEQGSAFSFGHDNTVQKLIAEKDKYKKEIDDKGEKIAELEALTEQLNKEKLHLTAEKATAVERVETLMQAVEKHKEELTQEERRHETTKRVQETQLGQLQEKETKVSALENELKHKLNEIQRLQIENEEGKKRSQEQDKLLQGRSDLLQKISKENA